MANTTFWAEATLEPKRQFRFLFILPGGAQEGSPDNVETYLVRQVNKPQITIGGETTVSYLQHTFKYPGRATWNDVTITLSDIIDPRNDVTSRLASMIRRSGYIIPDTETNAQFSINKQAAVNAVGFPRIQQLDNGDPENGRGPRVIEEWLLWNAYIKSVDFGGQLNYTSDALVDVTLTLGYDWAQHTMGNNEAPLSPGFQRLEG